MLLKYWNFQVPFNNCIRSDSSLCSTKLSILLDVYKRQAYILYQLHPFLRMYCKKLLMLHVQFMQYRVRKMPVITLSLIHI